MSDENANLQDFLKYPREALDVEIKDWLNLDEHDHRAALAKEIIALANHGGGYIVVGYREKGDGSFIVSSGRPVSLDCWSQDSIQSIIAKYIEPNIQCHVSHVLGEDDLKYPVISVPAGQRVPVRAKSGSPDGKRLVVNRVYVRRPGPNSEEPRTTEDWDRVFENCIRNRQADLLNAMRSIIAGVIPGSRPEPEAGELLKNFEAGASERWQLLTSSLPNNAPPKFPHGYYDVAFWIDGNMDEVSLAELQSRMQVAVKNHSGWPPFFIFDRPPFTPKPIDGTIECWIGPVKDGSYDAPSKHDFWRASPKGLLFTRRGYQDDDRYRGQEPGAFFDLTGPIWRLGETILQAHYIALALNAADAQLVCSVKYTALAGRTLNTYPGSSRYIWRNFTCSQQIFQTTKSAPVADISDVLPEVVFAILQPLYELFEFYPLKKRLVEEELSDLRSRSF